MDLRFSLEIKNFSKDPEDEYINILGFLGEKKVFALYPEDWEAIKTSLEEKDLEEGHFDEGTCNGEFSIYWTSEKVTWSVAKYGSGNGGSIMIETLNNQSFKDVLVQWKSLVEKRKNQRE